MTRDKRKQTSKQQKKHMNEQENKSINTFTNCFLSTTEKNIQEVKFKDTPLQGETKSERK